MKISEIKKLKGGATLDGVLTCVISDIGERRTIPSDSGFFTVQNAKLTQGDHGLGASPQWMFAEFVNHNDISVCDGHEIELSCTTSKHGTQGVAVKDAPMGNNVYKNLRITPSAKFLVGERVAEPKVSKRQQLKQGRK